MKLKEKKAMFEGFSNVLIVSMVFLFTGFFMGILVGAVGGIHTTASTIINICVQYPYIDMCSS